MLKESNKIVKKHRGGNEMKNIVSGIMGNTLRRYLIVALVASLAVTGGVFAYGYTTEVATITGSPQDWDFANVTANDTSGMNFNVFCSYRGGIPGGTVFTVHPAPNYNGDFQVNVYLSNLDELSHKYGMMLLRMAFVDPADNTSEQDVEMIEKPLTLNNGMVSFTCDNFTAYGKPNYAVVVRGGVYRSFPWAYLTGKTSGSYTPQLTCEVIQAGL